MIADRQRSDWNEVYFNEFPRETNTYSKKWAWHYSQHPFVQLPVMNTGGPRYPMSSYKKGGPHGTSDMYKRAYPVTYNGYVNELGDL